MASRRPLAKNSPGRQEVVSDPEPGDLRVAWLKPIILGREFPWILPSVGGLAIWATTPAFIYALRAPWDRWTLACWAGILLFCAVLFQFGGTGMTQLGYRFALDFYAPLTVLTIRGMDPPLRSWHTAFILVCVAINTWWVYTLNILHMERLF